MNAHAKGRKNELRTKKFFEKQGYLVELTKPTKWQSDDLFGLWDGIGISQRDVLLFQCKTGRSAAPHIRELLKQFPSPNPSCVRKVLVIWKDREPVPTIVELL